MEIAQKLFEAVDESKLKTLEEMKLIVAKYDFRQKGGEDNPTVSSGVMNVVADLTDSGKEMTENEFSEVTNYLKQFQIKKREGTTEKEKETEMDRKVREIIEWFEKRPKEEAKAAPDSAVIDAVKNKMASEPESEERRLDREKRMIDEAKEKFRPKVKYPNGLGNQNEMVDKVFDLLSAATTAASTPPEVIQAISGVFQLESELASFLSAVAAGTIANDDVRKMVASSLKSYITAYLAEYVLKKNSDMMIEVAQNDTPENVAAILEKVLKAVAMPSAPKLSPVKGVVPAPTAHAEPPKQGVLSSITSAATGMKKEAEAAPHDATVAAHGAQPPPVTATATAPAAKETTTVPAAISTAPAAISTAPAAISTAPAAKETVPTEAAPVPAAIATVPTEASTVSTAIATVPTEASTVSTAKETATAPTEAATVPAAKEIETVPTEAATVPTETATVPTEAATVPAEAATVPTETATAPTAKEAATAPTETATTPAAKEIETAPAAKETATVPTEAATAPASYAATKPVEGVNATQNKLQTDFEKTKKIQTDTFEEIEKRTKAVQEALNAPKSYEQLVLAEHLAKEELETSVANYEQNKDKDISLKQKYLEAKLKAESNYDVIKAKLEKAKNEQIKGGKKRKKSKSKTYYASAWTNKRNFRKRKHGQTRKGRRRFLV